MVAARCAMAAIVPDFEVVTTEVERNRNRQYIAWREVMERRRYPAVFPPRSHVAAQMPSIDEVWPYCECGAEREESRWAAGYQIVWAQTAAILSGVRSEEAD